jgi:hypothetical protein
MKGELEWIWKEADVTQVSYRPQIFLDGLWNTPTYVSTDVVTTEIRTTYLPRTNLL